MENKKEVEIPRLERGLSEPKSLVLPHDRYYKYMSDNLAGGLTLGPSPDHIHRGLSRTRAMSCAHLSEIPPHT